MINWLLALVLITQTAAAEIYDAVLEPKTRKVYSTQRDGVLLRCASLGSRLAKGEVILSQTTKLIEAENDMINLNIELLSREQQYFSKLAKKKKDQLKDGIIHREEYEALLHEISKIGHKINASRIELKKIKLKMQQSVIIADMNGVVTRGFKQLGEFSRTGEACVEVIDDSVLYAVFPYPFSKLKNLRAKSVRIHIDRKFYDGLIHFISPEVDGASGLVQVKIAIVNKNLRSGQQCLVHVD